MTDTQDTYTAPREGWTCFHCGEHFAPTPGGIRRAQEHFGADPMALAGCQIKQEERGLLGKLRLQEEELRRYRDEDSDKDRAMAAMASDHGEALRKAEEDGYARGVADMRKLCADLWAALRDVVPHMVGAAAAYRKYGRRYKMRGPTDPFFATRARDFEQAAERGQRAYARFHKEFGE